jgi:hypothetical protein
MAKKNKLEIEKSWKRRKLIQFFIYNKKSKLYEKSK